MTLADAWKRVTSGKPLGRCVMMLDAHEQAFSSALCNMLSAHIHSLRFKKECGFRNTIIRASSDWARMWEEVLVASCIVELYWKKFGHERPSEDIHFMIDVIIPCFQPWDDYEERLLFGHRLMLERSLIERPFITDDGGVFSISGMVPSGSLWTGWLDTALNILYIGAALSYLGMRKDQAVPKCAGDDNLTLSFCEVRDQRLHLFRDLLNRWFQGRHRR